MNPQVLSVLFVHLHHEYAANRSSYIGTSEAPVDVFAALALVEMADEDDGCACVLCNTTEKREDAAHFGDAAQIGSFGEGKPGRDR